VVATIERPTTNFHILETTNVELALTYEVKSARETLQLKTAYAQIRQQKPG